MSLKIENDSQVNNGGQDTSGPSISSDTQNLGATSGAQYLGFNNNMFLMSTNKGSDYTLSIAKAIAKVYDTLPGDKKPKVSILDSDNISKLAYSAVVISAEMKDRVYYYTILLEATGNKPMKAKDMIAELDNPKLQSNRFAIFTIDDAIDGELHSETHRILGEEYAAEQLNVTSLEGVILRTIHGEEEGVAQRLAAIAYNALTAEMALDAGQMDLNIKVAVNNSEGSALVIDANTTRQTITDEVDRPIRHDFSLDLSIVDTTNANKSLNLMSKKDPLVRVAGFVDSVARTTEVPNPTFGGAPIKVSRLQPNIVINSTATKYPTTGFLLLSLASSVVMTKNNMYLESLMPTDSDEYHNTGMLNTITNVGNEQNGGSPMDLKDKSIKTEEAYGFLNQMYMANPLLSFDIDSYGPASHYNSIFAVAAQPTTNASRNAKAAAAQEIVNAAHILTDGAFPKEYPLNKIFAFDSITVPTGSWADKSGERDIRDIDASFIATNKPGDTDLITLWSLSTFPKSITGSDPFMTKTKIINSIVPDAEISGRATRVTFNPEFIELLAQAVEAAGLNVRFKPTIQIGETQNLSIGASILDKAGIGTNVAGFATEYNNTQAGFSMAGSTMGLFKF